ncbi:biopolymer transporter ExbD [Teredinibacter sp. KSP-S5-2]|uniref:ExbD/TolR family protein n=1 Tax=Teredinibacter sp. KSP-S5-2 TaxID=3034506 RepID=UPI002934E83C|nr:biopolymer transporter ExbD [Teredinibacter sp. KSP-S5-2]WNO08058.1 biopolymer transporter ExbD [Teredinibacter sp. KSP-S5-2]
MKLVRRNRMQETVELNITAFMNLMVILVPFLLITAVFSRMTVLDLNLPALDAAANENTEEKFRLQLVIRQDSFLFQDGRTGIPLKSVTRSAENPNWKEFDEFIKRVKMKFPDSQDIALLLAKDVTYNTMIEVMDHVRSYDDVVAATLETYELFPNISIGNAPEISEQATTVEAGAGELEGEAQ